MELERYLRSSYALTFVMCNEWNNYDVIKIFPLEGETWALFKDWDMKWYPNLMSDKKFNYEFVEVLSDHVDVVGGHVAYLDKAKGFTCLFYREGSQWTLVEDLKNLYLHH
ncbi:hypothetical protein MTR67_039145 [Solanum verrucosum]|uniref:DUF3444 domain-containing protein n=1 Tax=Solanum verrucosum TaxID=315347 RepID=A0AAF0UGE9_SOLVR|nr:hypothetical protein MTR67_039145 [Solanum verrucosum]